MPVRPEPSLPFITCAASRFWIAGGAVWLTASAAIGPGTTGSGWPRQSHAFTLVTVVADAVAGRRLEVHREQRARRVGPHGAPVSA